MKLATTALIALAVQTALFSQAAPKLSLNIERVQGEGVSDHAVLVRIWIANISQQDVDVLFAFDPVLQYSFEVVGPDGRPVPPTRDAEKRRARVATSQPGLRLAPGQRRSVSSYPLSDLVDFSRPGKYRITATRHFGAPLDETDSSNVIEVTIP